MNNRTMLPALKNSAAAGYHGPGKIELLTEGAGLLKLKETGYFMFQTQNYDMAACSSQRYIVPPTTLTKSKQVNEFRPLCFAHLPHCVLISPNHYGIEVSNRL